MAESGSATKEGVPTVSFVDIPKVFVICTTFFQVLVKVIKSGL